MDFDNIYTIKGSIVHQRSNEYELRKNNEHEYEKFNVSIGNENNLYGIADAVLFIEDTNGVTISEIKTTNKYKVFPIEYKPAEYGGEIEQATKVQCVAQAKCLEHMFNIEIDDFFVYYQKQHKRKKYHISSEDRKNLIDIIDEMESYIIQKTIPPKDVDKLCHTCLAYEYCMPDLKQTTLTFNDYYKKASK